MFRLPRCQNFAVSVAVWLLTSTILTVLASHCVAWFGPDHNQIHGARLAGHTTVLARSRYRPFHSSQMRQIWVGAVVQKLSYSL